MNENTTQNAERNDTSDALNVRIDRFIAHLGSLIIVGREDRAALAALRSGLRGQAERTAAMNAQVMPFLGEKPHPSDRWFYVVGALFAWHPQFWRTSAPKNSSSSSLGASFRRLKNEEGAAQSIEARFAALLACDERDLHLHLRQAIGLLRAHDVPVDWKVLLKHLTQWGWNHPQRCVQDRWARDYYRKPHDATQAQTTI